jgi:hypothetical protein
VGGKRPCERGFWDFFNRVEGQDSDAATDPDRVSALGRVVEPDADDLADGERDVEWRSGPTPDLDHKRTLDLNEVLEHLLPPSLPSWAWRIHS